MQIDVPSRRKRVRASVAGHRLGPLQLTPLCKAVRTLFKKCLEYDMNTLLSKQLEISR